MATLSAATRRKLKYLHQDGAALQNPGQLACWNWALTGFGPVQINPDTAFSFVAGYIAQGDLDPAFQQAARLRRLQALALQWQPHVGAGAVTAQSTRDFEEVTAGIVKLAIEANGLAWTPAATPYQICMYHSDGLNGDGELNAPNYTHWWLRIDGGGQHDDGIEAFPGSAYITIRRPEYSRQHVFRISINELHAAHVQRINATLQSVIRANHNAVPHGAWAATVGQIRCSICNAGLNLINMNHHCRCCGRLVCASCSPSTRAGVARVQHPNGRDGVGAQRVCLFCE